MSKSKYTRRDAKRMLDRARRKSEEKIKREHRIYRFFEDEFFQEVNRQQRIIAAQTAYRLIASLLRDNDVLSEAQRVKLLWRVRNAYAKALGIDPGRFLQ